MGGIWGGDTITYGYDMLGQLNSQSINGISSSITFDGLGRVDSSTNPLGSFTRLYDGKTPRLKTLVYPTATGLTANYTYASYPADPRLQILENKKSPDTTLSLFNYTYYADGQIATLIKNLGGSINNISLEYDDSQWLTSALQDDHEFYYGYDDAGNRLSESMYFAGHNHAHEKTTAFTANILNQLDSVKVFFGLGQWSQPLPLVYDANGNLTNDGGKTYEWDAANRLTRIDYTDTGFRTEFAYDGLGRRVRIIEYGPAMVADIQPKDGGYTEFTTDPIDLSDGEYTIKIEGLNPDGGENTALIDSIALNGSLVENGGFETPEVTDYEVAPEESGWTWTGSAGIATDGGFIGDGPSAPEGRQAAFVTNDGSLSQSGSVEPGSYTLSFQAAQRANENKSAQTLRVTVRSVNSNKTFLWSGNTIAEERNSAGATVTKRFFAEGQASVNGATTTKFFYTRDHLGSIREVTDSTGTVVARYDYDAWGKQVATLGLVTASDFGYTGHYLHGPSGMNLTRTREYNPVLARWMSRDPIPSPELKQGPNLYGYVANDPTSSIDPLGLLSYLITLGPDAKGIPHTAVWIVDSRGSTFYSFDSAGLHRYNNPSSFLVEEVTLHKFGYVDLLDPSRVDDEALRSYYDRLIEQDVIYLRNGVCNSQARDAIEFASQRADAPYQPTDSAFTPGFLRIDLIRQDFIDPNRGLLLGKRP